MQDAVTWSYEKTIISIIITHERLQRAAGESHIANRVSISWYFIHLWGLWSSQLAHHFANEINQGPYYVKHFHGKIRTRIIPQLYIGHLLLELSPNRLQYLV